MRIYLRRFLWLILGAFLCSFVVLNVVQLRYEHGMGREVEPWGVNFHLDHNHGRISSNLQINKNGNSLHHHKSVENTTVPVSSLHNLKKMWPVLDKEETYDRIILQLYSIKSSVSKTKTIAIKGGGANMKAQERLRSEHCPVNRCEFIQTLTTSTSADAVIFFGSVSAFHKPPNQIWVWYQLESPYHSHGFSSISPSVINWTATYRRDSVLVTPYEKFVHFDNFTGLPDKPTKDFAAGKTKLVAWFVSNCNAQNGREHYVKELQTFISVDIYGGCGSLKCSRSNNDHCFDLLNRDYKFYLAFENSNCKDYITEKLYWNALGNDIVPVVMGAHPDDYLAVAPPESYIHVDHFESPKELANYLHKLDQNPDLYNSYFRWKGTGEFVNTKFWCRLCNMVHAADSVPSMSYKDINKWWRGENICVKAEKYKYATWKNVQRHDSFWKNNFNVL